jgi:hypothetical protein
MKDERSIKAVEAAIAFGEGNITRGELDAVAAAATYAADDAAVAAYAAVAAAAAAYAVAAAAAAAYAVAAATYAATDARTKNQLETADICRKYIGQLIIDKVNEILLK